MAKKESSPYLSIKTLAKAPLESLEVTDNQVLTIRGTTTVNPLIIVRAFERRMVPQVQSLWVNWHNVLMGHEQHWLQVWVGTLKSQEQTMTVDLLNLESFMNFWEGSFQESMEFRELNPLRLIL
ncbi:hypothetical protein WICPIJ_000505 [Wickerhamomyces pijperi]|uniref:Uncharacterized protein n=1 Tax=Wickerhamomyces pijperi TaxID=599730 RepID=A0A9P8QG52_WICPI|nr:hypothetical protein WICPIJ_000505 [Wickerhamomyces pijperi]